MGHRWVTDGSQRNHIDNQPIRQLLILNLYRTTNGQKHCYTIKRYQNGPQKILKKVCDPPERFGKQPFQRF